MYERGQAVVGGLIWIVAVAALLLGLARLGERVVDDARAQTAADAAALAAAASTDAAARDLATRNNAVIESIHRDGAEVQVVVRVGVATAVARARLDIIRVRP